ncbi:MAG: molecular chaperone HtpG [Clostridia bacterium]|nr:molecular chaperone HtpG [Clostridia bacterium]
MNQESTRRSGGISVETAHIFPIIKKWLYSEKDIFLRELVSNAADAVTKHKRLVSLGEIESGEDETYRITVTVDKAAGTLTVSDNGIGMTEEEVTRYLGNIALSGALDFINKYEGEGEKNATGIIGHFGLGFYSAFMVADTVEVITRSFTGGETIRWVCNADGSYEFTDAPYERGRGTDIILHVTEEESEYLGAYKVKDMLDKYCSFMPTEIYFVDADRAEGTEEEPADTDTENAEEKAPAEPTPINDTTPLWQKSPSECTEEEYKDFYRKVFRDYREPLFHIHINADYPLNFKGILYFPRLNNEYESMEGQVKLYYNQVFVADNIKEVIPEYLLMLKGVLDCPELPLNVSRSYLQNNTYVSKVSAHIVKKVCDKLNSLCLNERETYEGVWDSIKTFVEYACMRDRKFYDRVSDSLLFKLTDGKYVTVEEYFKVEEGETEPAEKILYYTSDPEGQAQYVSLFEAEGIKVAVLDRLIDTQFVQMYESYAGEGGVKFRRIDADVAAALQADGDVTESEALTALYREVSGNDKLEVKFTPLKDGSTPAMLTVSEESRRMEEMMRMYAMQGGMGSMPAYPVDYTLTVNTASPLTGKLMDLCEADPDKAKLIASQIYRLCLLSQRKLTAEELTDFLAAGFDLLGKL